MAFLSRLIKRLGFFEKSRPAAVARTRVMRLEPLEDRRLLTAAPDDFAVTNLPDTEVGLHWTPRPEQEVTGYEVEVSINGSDNWRPFFGHEPYVQSEVQAQQAVCDANVPPPPQQPPPCYFNTRDVYRSYYFRIQSLPAESTPKWSTATVFPAAPPEDNAVKVSAAVLPGVEMITLRWPQEPKFDNATYTISRKAKDDVTWTELVSGDTGNDWVDFDVEEGKAYEYEVKRSSPSGTGYVYAGLELALEDADSTIESPGTVILIVDDTQAAALATELDDDGDVGGEAVGRRGSIATRDLTCCSRAGNIRVIFKRTRTPYFSWGTAL